MDKLRGNRVRKAAIAFAAGMICASALSSQTVQDRRSPVYHEITCPAATDQCGMERIALLSAPKNTVYQKRVAVADRAIKEARSEQTATARAAEVTNENEMRK